MIKITNAQTEEKMAVVLLELLYRNHVVNQSTYSSVKKVLMVNDNEPKAA